MENPKEALINANQEMRLQIARNQMDIEGLEIEEKELIQYSVKAKFEGEVELLIWAENESDAETMIDDNVDIVSYANGTFGIESQAETIQIQQDEYESQIEVTETSDCWWNGKVEGFKEEDKKIIFCCEEDDWDDNTVFNSEDDALEHWLEEYFEDYFDEDDYEEDEDDY